MKRHLSLRRFSDDHHRGLVQARRLRRAVSGEVETRAEVARRTCASGRRIRVPASGKRRRYS
jgi:hypothetical protein